MKMVFLSLYNPPLPGGDSVDSAADTDRVEWITVDGEGTDATISEVFAGSFDEFVTEAHQSLVSMEIHALLPATCVTRTLANVPASNARQLMQALPFVVEEEIAGNIEEVHLATGQKLSSQSIPVAIVAHRLMRFWCDRFSASGLSLKTFVADADALDIEDNQLVVVMDGTTALVKSLQGCFACEPDNLPVMLSLLLDDENSDVEEVQVYYQAAQQAQATLAKRLKMEVEGEGEITAMLNVYEHAQLQWLATQFNYNRQRMINLLQGEYGASGNAATGVMRWWPVAAVASACLVIQIVFNIASGLYFSTWADRFVENANNVYRQTFPEEQTIINVRKQMEAKLRQSGQSGPGGFASLFGNTSDALGVVGKSGKFFVQQFRYDERSSELHIQLDVASISQLDALKKDIEQRGLLVDILSANESGEVIEASIVVKTG